jgi:hypothetical protein
MIINEDDPQKDLAKFGYKLKYRSSIFFSFLAKFRQ